jgi:hypothetical protein
LFTEESFNNQKSQTLRKSKASHHEAGDKSTLGKESLSLEKEKKSADHSL